MPTQSSKVYFQFEEELFLRPVHSIFAIGVPQRELDGSVKGVALLCVYDDGSQDVLYLNLAARRPVGTDDPRLTFPDPPPFVPDPPTLGPSPASLAAQWFLG